ncbi:MAG: ring-cleaving dioxygenase [Chitinophagaceae bacterium]
MLDNILGLHHLTAIATDAKRNQDFYTKVLGLRLVKKTVNFDDPGTYHFYFGDEVGTPGSILTFFPWKGAARGQAGPGMATNIGYSVPAGSLDFWEARFTELHVKHSQIENKLGEATLSFEDPDGLKLALIVSSTDDKRQPWTTREVESQNATKGFHNVTLTLRKPEATAEILTNVFGYRFQKQEGKTSRFITDAMETASIVDLVEAPEQAQGRNAAGTNHHVAFRVKDEKTLMEYREKIASRNLQITPKIDRDYFFSLYFREPGGVLFELATDNPGFAKDETVEKLGSGLMLPKQYESSRTAIEKNLPPL